MSEADNQHVLDLIYAQRGLREQDTAEALLKKLKSRLIWIETRLSEASQLETEAGTLRRMIAAAEAANG